MIIIHNENILDIIKKKYAYHDICRVEDVLSTATVFQFPRLSNGLFPAAGGTTLDTLSGYQHVWVRDNIHVAWALYEAGDIESAVKTVGSLLTFYKRHEHKMTDMIASGKKPDRPMDRPHIRFDGETVSELIQKWPHDQNDALGYFLWFTSKLIAEGHLKPVKADINLLISLIRYLVLIEYWTDEDSGHWEENRKIAASSIGTVLAGLYEFCIIKNDHIRVLLNHAEQSNELDYMIKSLIDKGEKSLLNILPHECIQKDISKQRKYDAALLFLLYPLKMTAINRHLENEILNNVREHLAGHIGIRRYRGDSYWFPDYKETLAPLDRTDDFSDDLGRRDKYLKPGQEAQWCIFDSILSCIYGERFKSSLDMDDYTRQCRYFNRALGQLTAETSAFGGMKCPEAYYLENGTYVENDHTPLLWAQANLLQAVIRMKASAKMLPDIGNSGRHG